MKKRKPIQRTISDVRQAPPRALASKREATARYPTAAELVSSSREWQRWLDEALRSVLRPAAMAGAVGLAAAASGCGREEAPPPPRVVALTVAEDASAGDGAIDSKDGASGVVMFPVPGTAGTGGGSEAGSGGIVAHPLPVQPPQPPSSGGSGPTPGPPATDGITDPDPGVTSIGPKPPVLPATRPPQIRGGVRRIHPRPDPPAIPGGL